MQWLSLAVQVFCFAFDCGAVICVTALTVKPLQDQAARCSVFVFALLSAAHSEKKLTSEVGREGGEHAHAAVPCSHSPGAGAGAMCNVAMSNVNE